MEKLSIANLVDFHRKSDKSKITFANNLKVDTKAEKGSGGDYWIHSLSTIGKVFKENESDLFDAKIEILQGKKEVATAKISKDMFQRNIDILSGFKDFDYESIKPKEKLIYYKKPEIKSIVEIDGLPIQARPNHVFSYSNNEHEEIGAVWFVAKLHGYSINELGMFTDILYRYLEKNYSKDFVINNFYCCAIDVSNGRRISYEEIRKGDVPVLLDRTIAEIKGLL